MLAAGCRGDCQPREPDVGPHPGSAYGSRQVPIRADIGPGVDPADHQVKAPALREIPSAKKNAGRGSAFHGIESERFPLKVFQFFGHLALKDLDIPAIGQALRDSALVRRRSDHDDISHPGELFHQRLDSGRFDAVIICQENQGTPGRSLLALIGAKNHRTDAERHDRTQ